MASFESVLHHGGVKFPKRSLWEKIQDWCIQRASRRVATVGGVSLRNFTRRQAYLLSLIYLCTLLLTFSVQWWEIITIQTKQDFLSLESTSETICTEVPITLDGTYAASLKGAWQTDYHNFYANQSAFVLKVHGARFTTPGYKEVFQSIAAQLGEMGKLAAKRNVLGNLIFWATYTINRPYLSFFSSADPGVIFSGQISQAVVSSGKGVCDPVEALKSYTGQIAGIARPLSAKFDSSLKKMTLRMPILRVTGSKATRLTMFQPCPGQGNWTDRSAKNRFTNSLAQFADLRGDLAFDVRSALLAMSLNVGIANLSGLLQTNSKLAEDFGLRGFIDPSLQPPMDPIYCLIKERAFSEYGISLTPDQFEGPPICMLADSFRTKTVFFFYPHVVQIKADDKTAFPWADGRFNTQTPCSCPEDAMNQDCNSAQNFYFSYFYSMNFSRIESVKFAADMQKVVVSAGPGGGDLALQNSFWKIETSSSIYKSNMDWNVSYRNNMPITSFTNKLGKYFDNSWANGPNGNAQSLTQLLNSEYRRICDSKCGAVVFQLKRYLGQTDLAVTMNNLNLQLGDLIPAPSDPIQYVNYTSMQRHFSSSQQELFRSLARVKIPFTMCKDTISQREALEGLTNKPPVPLVENYLKCRKTVLYVLVTTFGSTFASSALYVSIFWFILGIVVVRCSRTLLDDGAVLPSQHQLESLEIAHAAIEREKMIRVLEGMKGFVQGTVTEADISHRIGSLATTYRAVGDSFACDASAAVVAAQELSSKMNNMHQPVDAEAGVAEKQQTFSGNRRITLYSSPSAPPPQPIQMHQTSSAASSSSTRLSLSSHPLELVLLKSKRPSIVNSKSP